MTYQPALAQPKESAGVPTPDWIAAVAGNDTHFVTGCYDGFVRLYSPGAADSIAAGLAHGQAVTAVDLFATTAELLVASGSKDCSLKLSVTSTTASSGTVHAVAVTALTCGRAALQRVILQFFQFAVGPSTARCDRQ